jgi:uncharacterized protein
MSEVSVKVVDSDCHSYIGDDELMDYMPEPWRSRYSRYPDEFLPPPLNGIYVPAGLVGLRADSVPPNGKPGGSDPAFLDKQLLQEAGVDFAMLLSLSPRAKLYFPEFESALDAAHNALMADRWLGSYNWHGRYRGSIRVSAGDPTAAVREIEKWADHPYMSQIMLYPEAMVPFGHSQYHPIWEVAERKRLPVAFHVVIQPGVVNQSPVGFPSYHIELNSVGFPLRAAAQITSFIFDGVLDKFPNLKLVWVELGFTWVPQLMWRLDNQWRALRAEVPHVKRRPSEYIKDNMRFTTQPFNERPFDDIKKAMRWMEGERTLLFSTDYPHHDYDDPKWCSPRLPAESRAKIMCENAIDLYRLPRSRPIDALDLAHKLRRRDNHGS